MLQRIGMAAAPADAVDLLLECHVRIRAFLATARRLGEAGDAEPALVAETARQVHRYFTQALPLHAADEEASILPRLRGREPALDAALAVMSRQHLEHQPQLQVLVRACAGLADDPGRRARLGPVIAAATADLERQFADHLAREEAVILPAMRRLLDREADAAITAELRRRRQAAGPP